MNPFFSTKPARRRRRTPVAISLLVGPAALCLASSAAATPSCPIEDQTIENAKPKLVDQSVDQSTKTVDCGQADNAFFVTLGLPPPDPIGLLVRLLKLTRQPRRRNAIDKS
jgi:hypothetical protein